MKDNDKLRLWKDRLTKNEAAYEKARAKMDEREKLYGGTHSIHTLDDKDRTTKTPHVRNICAELVESTVNANIPQPKVTARRKKDERLAKIIEDMLRNELDRLPMEEINDLMERTVPIQGGAGFLLEWDNTIRTNFTVGELCLSVLHPKMIVPQDGVYTSVEDMDYFIVKVPQTKEYIRRRYGVSVESESEEEPDAKSIDGSSAEDMVTQYMAYYRNEEGGIGLYSWVGNTELEDLDDYQARRLRHCVTCGAVEPQEGVAPAEALNSDGTPGWDDEEEPRVKYHRGGKVCPYCGGTKWEERHEDYEELYEDIYLSDGSVIRAEITEVTGIDPVTGEVTFRSTGERTKIPYYKPDIYPVIIQKNVSRFGQLLGDSDIDKIADQQNTLNRLEKKIISKLVRAGSFVTMPNEACIPFDGDDMKDVTIDGPKEKSLFSVQTMQGDISQDLVYLAQVYEEARQAVGVTDSFQGRKDPTATSGKAKEFAAAQSAGRLESKHIMKNAAYSALFEAMFKFKLAYADEPRPVVSTDTKGGKVYEEFNRYDFLERDELGELHWNDQFLFSCDTTAPLASNREAMWQETRMNFESGAFGNPQEISTLILFWTKMYELHYPGAGDTKTYLEDMLSKQFQAAQTQPPQDNTITTPLEEATMPIDGSI